MYLTTIYRKSKQWFTTFHLHTSRKTKIVSAGAFVLVVSAFGAAGFAPSDVDTSGLDVKNISTELPLPNLQEQILSLNNTTPFTNINRVRAGDTIASLLNRLNVSDSNAFRFIQTDDIAKELITQRPGNAVTTETTGNGELLKLSTSFFNNGEPLELVITRQNDHFVAEKKKLALERHIEMRTGYIQSSLFAATDAAGISDSATMQMVDMFGTDINFSNDLRRGDQFKIIYETFWNNGHFVKTGRVLAGEFNNDGHVYRAIWYEDAKNNIEGSYYSPEGRSMRKAFLKYPLQFTRISSGFTNNRLHPILGKWKRHTGVDLAAPQGTPIRAAGDATVDFIGSQNGYGNIVVLKHWNGYSTAYGHMSRFANIKKGEKVSQGQVIGYVGQTGWATGPHLHYEFRINNQPKDPLSVKLPTAMPLSPKQLQHFLASSSDMTHRLTLLDEPGAGTVNLASVEE